MNKHRCRRNFLLLALALGLTSCSGDPAPLRQGSPLEVLPPQITPLLDAGLRADWSADGRRMLFLDALVGDVYELDLGSGQQRALTRHFPHLGFTRARYLASGDILLCGPRKIDADDEHGGRWRPWFWLLPADGGPALPIEQRCFEGVAVSRKGPRIAFTVTDYPDKLITARSEIWLGDIVTNGEGAAIVNRRKLVGRRDFYYLAMVEPQDFRFPEEQELIFTAYGWRGGEVMGVDIDSGAMTNYSRHWGYDEVEGVAPDGSYAMVEREPQTLTMNPKGTIDIWRLSLDADAPADRRWQRITYFSDHAGYCASNPVISPDGRLMAFQLRLTSGDHGNGAGILLYDLKHELAPRDETE